MTTYEKVLEQIAAERRTWLVTGVAGFIGSHLLEKLLMLDQQVVGLDNFSTGSPVNLSLVEAAVGEARWQNFKFIEGDIRSLETCRQACDSVDYVLHQAALGSVPRSVDNPINSNDNNVTGFLNMLVAARDAEVSRFVYAASSSTYGDDPRLPKIESVIGHPLSPYAVTKYLNELYADVFARNYGMKSIGLRYFNVFGPRQRINGEYPAVIPAWISSLLNNETIFVNGDGKTGRDFCYVENAVQANLLAAVVEQEAAINQVYNVAVNAQTSLNEVFEMIREMVAVHYPKVRTVAPVYREERKGDMKFSQADISKANRLLGYSPLYRVRQGLEKTVAWYVSKWPGELAKSGSEQSQSVLTQGYSNQPTGNSAVAVPEAVF
jgi:UDP-N-acetylglucosamine 4-epimerase